MLNDERDESIGFIPLISLDLFTEKQQNQSA